MIAHLSDPHIEATECLLMDRTDTPAQLASAVTTVGALQLPATAVVFNGDLVYMGSAEDLALGMTVL
ncbi:hypothetical protein [Hydrogenophaga sp.]|uniref:hypothetical protein n=1 Tax=Hydrogenophaga sp. TaxID=1904254 RepID=UPI0025BC9807|nr:hypothetical protein [Hydrogenophaga sp.]MBT9465883.1 hypothetical protein [Hydrogenophaga sp.]